MQQAAQHSAVVPLFVFPSTAVFADPPSSPIPVPTLGKRSPKPSAKVKAGGLLVKKKKAVRAVAAAKREATAAKAEDSEGKSKLAAVHGDEGAQAMELTIPPEPPAEERPPSTVSTPLPSPLPPPRPPSPSLALSIHTSLMCLSLSRVSGISSHAGSSMPVLCVEETWLTEDVCVFEGIDLNP